MFTLGVDPFGWPLTMVTYVQTEVDLAPSANAASGSDSRGWT